MMCHKKGGLHVLGCKVEVDQISFIGKKATCGTTHVFMVTVFTVY
jgi:hypothetical protein